MKMEDIKKAIFDQMKNLKSVHIEPVCIVVSRDVMYDIEDTLVDYSRNPYQAYFIQGVVKTSKDTFAGIPIGVVEAGDDVKEYIQVGGMV